MSLLTIINDGDKLFDEKFPFAILDYKPNPQKPNSLYEWDGTTTDKMKEIKSFTHSRELALLEGLKVRYEVMKKYQKDIPSVESNVIMKMRFDCFNESLSLAIAELDEAITHLKK